MSILKHHITRHRVTNNLKACISNISIRYQHGTYEVFDENTPVSKHTTLPEAQWVKSVLEKDRSTQEKEAISNFEKKYHNLSRLHFLAI